MNRFKRLLAFGFLIVTFAAVPAFAIQNAGNCYQCQYVYDPGNPMGSQGFCDNPQSGEWGYTQCKLNWTLQCVTSGEICYYIEVRPR
ncbi:MAG TPA: hypothetical protein VF846_17070 [Thermoanaerobaculia bacterium]